MNTSYARFRGFVTDPQFLALFLVLGMAGGMLYFFGFQLIPFLIAFVLAYFLDGGVSYLMRRGLERRWAVAGVFSVYLVVYLALLVGPLQLMARRAVSAVGSLAANTDRVVEHFRNLPDPTYGLLPENLQQDFVNYVLEHTQAWLSYGVSTTLGLVPQVTSWIVFLLLVPLLVFFFLKDKEILINGIVRCLPRRRELVTRIWSEMETQMGNYVRGKIWEILIVAIVTWLVFAVLGFQFPVVFGALTGFSVLIPYVGAFGLTVPVFIYGLLQWGMSTELGWLLAAYAVIQFLDGNVLVPLIFSEVVKLHPVVILMAVFIFGSIWGFWGVLFAIPLATFAKALLNAVLEYRDRREREGTDGEIII